MLSPVRAIIREYPPFLLELILARGEALLARKASSEGTASSLSILATSEHSSCTLFRHSQNHVS